MTPAQLDALVEGEAGLRPPPDDADPTNSPRVPSQMAEQLALHRRLLHEEAIN